MLAEGQVRRPLSEVDMAPSSLEERERVLHRHAVQRTGRPEGRTVVLVHGFGCDSAVWRFLRPHLEQDYDVVTFDLVGAGRSDPSAYDPARYDSLDGYADDLVQLCEVLDLSDAALIGHSVSAMTVVLAAPRLPERVTALVLVAPSPRYLDDEGAGYRGGFTRADVDQLLDALESNWVGWAESTAPMIMGAEHPELGQDLAGTFCRIDPDVAAQFAEVTFLSDNRADLAQVEVPTLVLQCSQDALAAVAVGEYVADELPKGSLQVLHATGHCPHMSAPDETAAAVRAFLGG